MTGYNRLLDLWIWLNSSFLLQMGSKGQSLILFMQYYLYIQQVIEVLFNIILSFSSQNLIYYDELFF